MSGYYRAKTKLLRVLLVLLFVCVGTAAAAKDVAPARGRSYETAVKITESQYANRQKAVFTTKDRAVYYHLYIKNAGRVIINLETNIFSKLTMTISDEQKNQIISYDFSSREDGKKLMDTWTEFMDRGSYYLTFTSGETRKTGNAFITFNGSKADVNDMEPNNSKESAQPIFINKQHTGLLTITDRLDIYQISVASIQSLEVEAASEFTGTLKIKVEREDGSYTGTGTAVHNAGSGADYSYHYSQTVEAGKYFIYVEADPSNHNTGKYTILANSKVALHSIKAAVEGKIMGIGEKYRLKAILDPVNTTETIKYSSSKKGIAAVSSTGIVTAKKPGKAVITIKASGGKLAKCTITVKDMSVKNIQLNKNSLKMEPGDSIALKTQIQPSNAVKKTVSWMSTDRGIATVDQKGKVKAIKAGSCVIIAEVKSVKKKAVCKIVVKKTMPAPTPTPKPTRKPAQTQEPVKTPKPTVKPVIAVKSISMRSSMSLLAGETGMLYASCTPSNAANQTIKWSSNNTSVAKVSKGKVTAVSKGMAVITASTKNGVKAYCTVYIR